MLGFYPSISLTKGEIQFIIFKCCLTKTLDGNSVMIPKFIYEGVSCNDGHSAQYPYPNHLPITLKK